jgi:F-type H+-transporting ATPase subunit b
MALDWSTLALEGVNFLILVWLLQRFLYRPVLAAIDRRREATERLLAQAEATRNEAQALQDKLVKERDGLAAERIPLLEKAQADAEAERQRLIEAARSEATAIRKEGHARLEHERTESVIALRRHAARLAVELAERLVRAAGDRRATDALLEGACAALEQMPAEERRAMLGSEEDVRGRIITAEPLDERARARCRQRLAGSLGIEPRFEFAADASLVAGVEIHLPHAVLRHSWRSILDEALSEMTSAAEPERVDLDERTDAEDARRRA